MRLVPLVGMKLAALASSPIVVAFLVVISGIACGGRVASDAADAGATATATASAGADADADASTTRLAVDAGFPTGARPRGTLLFFCDSDGGEWPQPHGNAIAVTRTGPTEVSIGDRELTVTVVDKTGPESGNVEYAVHTSDGGTFKLSGMIALGPANPAFPMEIVGPSTTWWSCADGGGPADHDHLFDTSALDALVADTGGKTVRY